MDMCLSWKIEDRVFVSTRAEFEKWYVLSKVDIHEGEENTVDGVANVENHFSHTIIFSCSIYNWYIKEIKNLNNKV